LLLPIEPLEKSQRN